MVWINEPVGELAPAALLVAELRYMRTSQHRRRVARYDFAQLQWISAKVDRHVDDLVLGHSHC